MAGSHPKVSVIIATYNSRGTLRLTLETVLRQRNAEFEVLVIGDGCTDDSGNVIESLNDDRIQWTNLPTNSGGPSIPRNEGLRRAKGEYIAYLGHDDLWFPWHLSELIDCIEKRSCDFVFSLGMGVGPDGIVRPFSLPERAWNPKSRISPSNWLHRKSLIEAVGHWSTSVTFGDDREFLKRMRDANIEPVYRPELSVIKFAAARWKMYSLAHHFPQKKYVDAMRADAEGLKLRLLVQLATHISWESLSLQPRERGLKAVAKTVFSSAMDCYGHHRWPVNRFLYWIWRRKSGLNSKKG